LPRKQVAHRASSSTGKACEPNEGNNFSQHDVGPSGLVESGLDQSNGGKNGGVLLKFRNKIGATFSKPVDTTYVLRKLFFCF
jgi:hypothetical protein